LAALLLGSSPSSLACLLSSKMAKVEFDTFHGKLLRLDAA
jgi:hypothetical protein